MLLRYDPFRDLDRLFEAATGSSPTGVARQMPMSAVRRGDTLHVSFDLPGVDTDRIGADYRDGVLHVTIPVAQAAKPRKVSISGTGDAGTTIEASSSSSEAGSDPALEEQAVSA
jgi:HSP20 family molecular chaperone IbpA